MSIRVILADDHKIVRDGLCALLQQNPEIEVVGLADNGLQLQDIVREQKPDLILMDVTMPDMNGIEATRILLANHPEIKVIFLSMQSERHFVTEALSAGACGYVLKESAFEELLGAIQAVTNGGFFLSPKITGIVVRDYINPSAAKVDSVYTVLSNREREVLQKVAEGKSTKEIAFFFHVSVKTVETQRQHIMKKLNIYNVADLTKYAIREGLTTL